MSEIWLKMYIGLHLKYLSFLSDFNEARFFSTYFRKKKKPQILNFVKILPVETEFYRDGQA